MSQIEVERTRFSIWGYVQDYALKKIWADMSHRFQTSRAARAISRSQSTTRCCHGPEVAHQYIQKFGASEEKVWGSTVE